MKLQRAGWTFALATLACGGTDAGTAASVRDSAGVEIVENPGDNRSLPQWRIRGAPVSIGVLDGEVAYQFDGLRGAMLHRDRIVVLDGGSRELRFFDLEGRHLQTAGRRGGGPGEFANPTWLGRHSGDSIIVYDAAHRRWSVLDGDGVFARSFLSTRPVFGFLAQLADGAFVVLGTVLSQPLLSIPDGPQRLSLGVFRVSADGQQVDTLGVYPGSQGIMESRLDGRQKRLHPLPFGLTTQVAAADSVVYVGSTDAWVIEVLDSNGTLRRSIRRTMGRSSVTPDMVERHRRAQLASLPTDSARQDMERFLATVDHPERLPAYGELRVADDGNLWVQDFLITSEDSSRWTVFEPSGRVAARVALPPGLSVDQIGSDFVLGRARDALDVERVERFRLFRE